MRLPKPPWIVAHRGALPLIENTIPALLRAVEERADLLEFDVRATADDILVLHHDADLGRLAGRPDLTIEKARLREISALELRQAERSPPTAPPGRIATLDELFAALPQGFPVNIELKSRRATPANRRRLAGIALAATTGRENVLFSSFDADLLRELRRESSTARLAPIASRWTPGLAGLGQELAAWSLHVARGVARAAAAAAAGSSAAPPLLVYTINVAAQAHALLAAGAAGLFTDRPAPLRTELGQLIESGVLPQSYRGTGAPPRSA